MKWFFRWFADKCQRACSNQVPLGPHTVTAGMPICTPNIRSRGMNFSLYRAAGGYIVEYQQYDQKHDNHHTSLHVITDQEELGEAIGKIVMLEMLRN